MQYLYDWNSAGCKFVPRRDAPSRQIVARSDIRLELVYDLPDYPCHERVVGIQQMPKGMADATMLALLQLVGRRVEIAYAGAPHHYSVDKGEAQSVLGRNGKYGYFMASNKHGFRLRL